MKEKIRSAAIETILEMWSCIDWDKVDSKRAMNIWDEVASKVKASAMTTNSYEKFLEKLARKLNVRSLKYKTINEIIKENEEFKKSVLKLIREETLSIMLEVRLNNELRKEQARILKEKQQKERELAEKLNNAQVEFNDKGVTVNENM